MKLGHVSKLTLFLSPPEKNLQRGVYREGGAQREAVQGEEGMGKGGTPGGGARGRVCEEGVWGLGCTRSGRKDMWGGGCQRVPTS